MYFNVFVFVFRYSIPDTPYSVPASVTTSDLSSLVNSVLKPGMYGSNQKCQIFDIIYEFCLHHTVRVPFPVVHNFFFKSYQKKNILFWYLLIYKNHFLVVSILLKIKKYYLLVYKKAFFIVLISDASEFEHVSFDFLVYGHFLRTSLEEHVNENNISTVSVTHY